jgi:hypothetical protein
MMKNEKNVDKVRTPAKTYRCSHIRMIAEELTMDTKTAKF